MIRMDGQQFGPAAKRRKKMTRRPNVYIIHCVDVDINQMASTSTSSSPSCCRARQVVATRCISPAGSLSQLVSFLPRMKRKHTVTVTVAQESSEFQSILCCSPGGPGPGLHLERVSGSEGIFTGSLLGFRLEGLGIFQLDQWRRT